MLRRSARSLLERECPPAHVRQMMEEERGYSLELWRKIAELGWLGLVLPEEHGGAGLNYGVAPIYLTFTTCEVCADSYTASTTRSVFR